MLGGAWMSTPIYAQSANESAALVAEGRRHIAEGNSAQALRAFEEAIAQDPDNAEALFFAGFLYIQAEHLQAGITALTRSVELAPERYRVRLQLAKAQEKAGAREDALREYRRVIQDAPAGAPEAEDARKRITELEVGRTLDEVGTIALSPDTDTEVLIAAGKQRLTRNNPEGALEAFELARAKQPDDAELLFLIGNVNLQLDRMEPGLQALERSLQLSPNNYRLRLALARAYERFATPQEALQQLRTVVAMAPPGASEAIEAQKEIERLSKGTAMGISGKTEPVDDPTIAALKDVPSLLNEARARMARGDSQGALRAAEAAQTLEPSHAEALYFIGNLQLQLKNPEAGLRALARSAALVPDNYRVRLVLARGLDSFGDPAAALREYRLVIATAPPGAPEIGGVNDRIRVLSPRIEARQNPELAQQQFMRLLQQHAGDDVLLREILGGYISDNNTAGAQHLLEALIAQQPENVKLRSFLVEIYEHTDQTDQAIAQYHKLLEMLPPDSDMAPSLRSRILSLQGTTAIKEGNFAQARDLFQELLSIDPNDISAAINLAVAYHGLDQKDQALDVLKKMAAQRPDSPDVHFRLAALYLELERKEDGTRELEETRIASGNSPATKDAQQLLATLYAGEAGAQLRQQTQDKLIQDRRAPLIDNSDDYEAWSRLAAAAQTLNRPTDLREAYENMLRLKPEDGMTQAKLGEIYDMLSEFKLAEGAYQRALELLTEPPLLIAALNNKLESAAARRAATEGSNEEAERRFRAIAERNPDDYTAHFYLAMLLAARGAYVEAAHEYEEVIRIVPQHGPAHLSLGMLYEQMRREEDALDAYRTALARTLPSGLEVTARERLAALSQRLDGFSYSVGYQSGYDSNFNLSRDNPSEEFRSSLNTSVTYRRKLYRRPIFLGISLTGGYQTFHRGQFDMLSLGYNPFVSAYWKGLDYSLNYTHNSGELLLLQIKQSTTDEVSGTISGSFTMPKWLSWLGDGQVGSGLWDFTLSANQMRSATSPIFDANNYTIGGTVNQQLGTGWRWTLGYNYGINNNTTSVGSDFAYTSHSVSAQLIRFLRPGLSANAGYNTSYLQYTYPDSLTLYTRHRVNFMQNMSLGINYYLSTSLRLFANMSYRFNESNLPTGFILSPEDSATAIGLQSSSLGDYSNISTSAGVSFSF